MPKDANGLEIVTFLLPTDPVRYDVTNIPLDNLETRDNDLLDRLVVRGTNLPGNPGFEDGPTTLFSTPANGTTILPYWTSQGLTPAGSEAQKTTVNVNNSDGALRIKAAVAVNGRIEQTLSQFKPLRGKKVTFSCDLRFITTNGGARLIIDDGVGTSTVIVTTLTTNYQRFTIERTMDAAASQCIIKIYATDGTNTSGQVIMDNATFITGSYPQGATFITDPTQDVTVARTIQAFSATGGETSLTLTLFTYTPGASQLILSKNGLDQIITVDFTETSTTVIGLVAAAVAGDRYQASKIA